MRKYLPLFIIFIVLVSCNNQQKNALVINIEPDIQQFTPAPIIKSIPTQEISITPTFTSNTKSTLVIPKDSRIVFSNAGGIYIFPTSTEFPSTVIDDYWHYIYLIPSWSPDGEQIVFSQIGYEGRKMMMIINRDGSGLRFLRSNADMPAWSPDGEHIAFVKDSSLYVTNANGSYLQPLVNSNPTNIYFPSWSPDGKRLVFLADSVRDDDPYKIFIVDSDGKNLQPLTKAIAGLSQLAWSPDGKMIYFASFDGCGDIYALDIIKRTITNLTNTPEIKEWDPAVSAEGNYILISTDLCNKVAKGNYEEGYLSIMRENGQDVTHLLQYTGFGYSMWPLTELRVGWTYSITRAGENLNIRVSPTKSAKSLATLPKGTVFSIINGPQNSDGFSWWRIRTNKGDEGWIVDTPGWFMFESADVKSPY